MAASSAIESRADFGFVRYAQCWEDADILLEGLRIPEKGKCLSICSAGDNTLALLTKNPEKVLAIDLSQAQLHCLELRVAAYRLLAHHEMLELVGSRASRRRKSLLETCRPGLSDSAYKFWEARLGALERWGAGGVGKFEGYFRAFSRFALPLFCSKKNAADLFAPRPQSERLEFYRKNWDGWRWRLLLKIVCSRALVGRFSRDMSFFKYVEGTLPEHIGARVAHALQDLSPAENPYLHWILFGEHSEALPLALREEHYETIRGNLDRLEWRRQSVEEFIATGEKMDAFNLSDIFEYMSEAEFERLYAGLLACANSGARFVYWNMMVPRSMPGSLGDKVAAKTELAKELHLRDKAFFYSNLIVEESL